MTLRVVDGGGLALNGRRGGETMFQMRKRCLDRCLIAGAIALLTLAVSPAVYADIESCPAVPDPIKNGFRSYQFKGTAAAVLDWTFNSYYAAPNEMDSLVRDINVYRNKLGEARNYHILGADRITPNTSVFYVGAGHERGELFFKLIYFCEKDAWILSDRPQFHPDPDFIISQNYYLRSLKDLQEAGAKKGK